MLITSDQNDRVKDIAKLQEKKYRDRLGKFTAETYYPIKYLLESSFEVENVFFCADLAKSEKEVDEILLLAEQKNIEIVDVSVAAFKKMAYVQSYDGLLAVAKLDKKPLSELKPVENGLYLVVESIEQVSDLGTLVRLADNAGVDAVIVCEERIDIFNPGVIRSSIGSVITQPIFHASSAEAVEWLSANNVEVLTTTPHAKDSCYDKKMTGSVAIVMGNEYTGVSSLWLGKSTHGILIPMKGKVNSLSVATSAAIVLYEALRQRLAK